MLIGHVQRHGKGVRHAKVVGRRGDESSIAGDGLI